MREELREHVSDLELAILRLLSEKSAVGDTEVGAQTIEVTEISSTTGIRDKDDIVRALYTLEGKSLAQPFPVGDFTSNQWHITNVGVQAISLLREAGRI